MSSYQCPKCGCNLSQVFFTKASVKYICRQWTAAVRRRRECRNCGHRWSTVEMEESDTYWVPKVGKDEKKEEN